MVGVQALCSCNFANISDFSHVAVLLRIVLPAFNFLNILMYIGYNTIAPIKVARVKLRIKIRLLSMFYIDSIKFLLSSSVLFSLKKARDIFKI